MRLGVYSERLCLVCRSVSFLRIDLFPGRPLSLPFSASDASADRLPYILFPPALLFVRGGFVGMRSTFVRRRVIVASFSHAAMVGVFGFGIVLGSRFGFRRVCLCAVGGPGRYLLLLWSVEGPSFATWRGLRDEDGCAFHIFTLNGKGGIN